MAGPEPQPSDYEIRILQVGAQPDPEEQGVYRVLLETTRGAIRCLFHPSQGDAGAVVWVGGALGGFSGPAGGLYADLGRDLLQVGVSSLRLDYRQPNELAECSLDVLAGFSFLGALGGTDVVVVGHSFGGGVAITAGALSPLVKGVVAMSSQLQGARGAARLAPRRLLLIHGTGDTVLDHRASEIIYNLAQEPKELIMYPRAGHGLMECAEEVRAFLRAWLTALVGRQALQARG